MQWWRTLPTHPRSSCLSASRTPASSTLCLCWCPGDYQETNTSEGSLSTISQKFATVHTLFSSLTPPPPTKMFPGIVQLLSRV